MNQAKTEAVANADAELNNAGLPTYSELLVALRDCNSMLDLAYVRNENPFGARHEDARAALCNAYVLMIRARGDK